MASFFNISSAKVPSLPGKLKGDAEKGNVEEFSIPVKSGPNIKEPRNPNSQRPAAWGRFGNILGPNTSAGRKTRKRRKTRKVQKRIRKTHRRRR